MSRLSLQHLSDLILGELDDEWRTPTEIADELGLGHGIEWYKVALLLERLANDGYAELKTPGSTVRHFRERQA